MKNLFLFSLIFLMGVGAFSQKEGITLKEARKIMKTAIYQAPNEIVVNPPKMHSLNSDPTLLDPEETAIGYSYYDLQTNALLQNRIYRWEDGCIGVVWNLGIEEPPYFPDRGTGYNFFNGTAWGQSPAARLESDKTAFPSYAPLGPNGEIVVSHGFDNGNSVLFILTREEKGIGDWNEIIYTGTPGPGSIAIPSVQTSGPDRNIIHILANSYVPYFGQNSALLYSRSMDAGQTWGIQNVVLEGTGSAYYNEIGLGEYVWSDQRNGSIAFLCASMWHDMFMMKSEDNGNTWEKTVIWEHPYPFYNWNTVTDTFFCVDNSASIALDTNGKAHVVFGITRVGHFEAGTTYSYWPYCDGIGYWNEDMDVFSNNIHALSPPDWGYPNTEMAEDYNYIGWSQDVDGDGLITFNDDIFSYRQLGVSTMPTISVDADGYIIVLYSSTTETYVYMDYNYKHIWGRVGHNGEWLYFHDLTSSVFHLVDECIYPQLTSNSDESIHYFYQLDEIPGLAFLENHEYSDNTEVYGTIEKSEFIPPIQIQNIYVEPGNQFVSSKISPGNSDMAEVAANIINDDLQYIRNSTGAMLRKIGPDWINGIGDWVDTEGYLIKTSASGEFMLIGSLIDPSTPIQLMVGFQFVSYLPEIEMDAMDAFASIIDDELEFVMDSDHNMVRRIGPNWVNGIGDCIPTEGYLIKMAADAELIYPADGEPASLTTIEKSESHFSFEGGNPAEQIWAIYIRNAEMNIDGNDLEAGDEIAIFDEDLLVGVFVLTQVCTPENQMENVLNAFSELFSGPGYTVGNPFFFRAWDQSEDLELPFEGTFSNPYGDAYAGDVFPSGDPYSIASFDIYWGIDDNEINVSIYPNPATNTLNINSDSEVSNIKVLNYLGQTIDNIKVNGIELTVNTSTYNSGIYFIQIETEKGISTQKIVIE
ncbi:MAG: T9SS type A sorting domain-containing protein [Bacteroidales bacterium]|nr:T9SS type A sorting domain-containing protein [Bacteroidales bacterium]